MLPPAVSEKLKKSPAPRSKVSAPPRSNGLATLPLIPRDRKGSRAMAKPSSASRAQEKGRSAPAGIERAPRPCHRFRRQPGQGQYTERICCGHKASGPRAARHLPQEERADSYHEFRKCGLPGPGGDDLAPRIGHAEVDLIASTICPALQGYVHRIRADLRAGFAPTLRQLRGPDNICRSDL